MTNTWNRDQDLYNKLARGGNEFFHVHSTNRKTPHPRAHVWFYTLIKRIILFDDANYLQNSITRVI